jgi:hypothetical protein
MARSWRLRFAATQGLGGAPRNLAAHGAEVMHRWHEFNRHPPGACTPGIARRAVAGL